MFFLLHAHYKDKNGLAQIGVGVGVRFVPNIYFTKPDFLINVLQQSNLNDKNSIVLFFHDEEERGKIYRKSCFSKYPCYCAQYMIVFTSKRIKMHADYNLLSPQSPKFVLFVPICESFHFPHSDTKILI